MSLSNGGTARSLASKASGGLGLTLEGGRLAAPELAGADAVYRDVERGVDILVKA